MGVVTSKSIWLVSAQENLDFPEILQLIHERNLMKMRTEQPRICKVHSSVEKLDWGTCLAPKLPWRLMSSLQEPRPGNCQGRPGCYILFGRLHLGLG